MSDRSPATLAVALWMTAGVGGACAHPQEDATPTPPLPTPPPPRTMGDARGLTEYSNAVQAYVALHKRAAAALRKLPDQAEPAMVAVYQKTLAEAIRQSGPRPRQGHVSSPTSSRSSGGCWRPSSRARARPRRGRRWRRATPRRPRGLPKDPDVKPRDVPLLPYADYPADAPVSTMPPPVLLKMPQLPKELEYRFVGKNLVLRDTVANIIVDFIPQAVP